MTPVNQHLHLSACAGNQFVCLIHVAERDPDPAHVGAAQNTGHHKCAPVHLQPTLLGAVSALPQIPVQGHSALPPPTWLRAPAEDARHKCTSTRQYYCLISSISPNEGDISHPTSICANWWEGSVDVQSTLTYGTDTAPPVTGQASAPCLWKELVRKWDHHRAKNLYLKTIQKEMTDSVLFWFKSVGRQIGR